MLPVHPAAVASAFLLKNTGSGGSGGRNRKLAYFVIQLVSRWLSNQLMFLLWETVWLVFDIFAFADHDIWHYHWLCFPIFVPLMLLEKSCSCFWYTLFFLNLTSLFYFFPSGLVDLWEEAVLLAQGCKFRGMPVMAVLQMCQWAVRRSSRVVTSQSNHTW